MQRAKWGGRKGVSAAAVLAAAIVVTAGVTAVLFYSSLTSANGLSGTSTSESESSPSSTSLLSTTSLTNTTFTLYPNSTRSTTVSTASSPTSTSTAGGWQEWAVLNATLGYYKTQTYIHDAWNYTFNVVQTGTNGPSVFISDYVVAVGPLQVQGNWSTGYALNYTRISSLNVSVQYTPGSEYYPVIFFSARNSTGITEPIQFNSTQKQAIAIAVTNRTVENFTQQYPTFVDSAWVFPTTNSTFGGDYLISIFQINGPRILNVFVNMGTSQVVSTYNDTRTIEACFSYGVCFASPWP